MKCLKPGGKIGNVNYLGKGDYIDIPRVEWGVGMGHKQINGGLKTLTSTIEKRDDRLRIFTKLENDTLYYHEGTPVKAPVPEILNPAETRATTGYRIKKGLNYSETDATTYYKGTTGSIVFRGAEALLNYMEANYVLDGTLDGSSISYWQALRRRAGVDTNYQN